MTLECINPSDLPIPATYTQVVVARGTKLIFVSGQEPEDLQGKLVGRGDFAAQAHQVFTNLGRALAAAGALPTHVAKITVYVVDYQRDLHLPIIETARMTPAWALVYTLTLLTAIRVPWMYLSRFARKLSAGS
jgi:enamine deaminase RidA (YjgF/YER057c/UK114 family)